MSVRGTEFGSAVGSDELASVESISVVLIPKSNTFWPVWYLRQKIILAGIMPIMGIEYATVKAKGQVVIPVQIRRRFQIDEGTRVAFLEEGGRLFIQPVTDEFIEGMKGVLAGRGLPARIEKERDRTLR